MTHVYDVVSHDTAEDTVFDSTPWTDDDVKDDESNSHVRLLTFSSEQASRLRSKDFHESRRKSVDDIDPIEAKKWLNPYCKENIGIFSSYLAVGFGMYFIQTPLQYYMVDELGATAAQQSVVMGLLHLPWALKIFCGFITDSLPMFGMRRKPYFFLGWMSYALCNIVLAIIGKPSIGNLAALVFGMTLCFVQADVCTDAMIVERSKSYEHSKIRGTLQATGYIIRYFGAIIGALFGAILYNKGSWGWGLPIWGVFLMNATVPIVTIAPFFYNLVEIRVEEPPVIGEQLRSMWALVQRKAVWRPCSFVYIYNVFLLTNPAWNSFLINGLGFSNFDLGLLVLSGTILSYTAISIYKAFLFDVNWRHVYIFATVCMALFTCLQLVLVFGLNKDIGMGSIELAMIFAVLCYGGVQFVLAIQFLPQCRMYLGMCPVGAEGASYAMLTTISNVAQTVAYSFAGAMAGVWDVSNDTLEAHDYSGMWKLTLFVGCVQLTGLLFVYRMPTGIEEQLRIQATNKDDSVFMGAVFVFVLGASMCFVIGFSIKTIITG